MKVSTFKTIAHLLFKAHYGINLGDTTMCVESIVCACIEDGQRPFESINAYAQDCDLDRVDKAGAWGIPSKDALTAADEDAVLKLMENVYLVGEEMVQCPKCRSRTHFDEMSGGVQVHTCVNSDCKFVFVTEECGTDVDEDANEEVGE